MSSRPRARSVVKANECLLESPKNQKLLAWSSIRFLHKLLTRKAQLFMYLDLADMHLADGTIPPGLQISLKPPGYSNILSEQDLHGWTARTNQCSSDLLIILRQKYLRDIKKCEELVKYTMSQICTIISRLQGVARRVVQSHVGEIVQKISKDSMSDLLRRCDRLRDYDIFERDRGKHDTTILQSWLLNDNEWEKFVEIRHEHFGSRETQKTSDDTKLMEHHTHSAKRLSFSESRLTYDNIYPEQRTDTFAKGTKNRIEAEEEEMKYLEFINGVTNDILTKGIYSDRVLTQVMQRHLDQNRGHLNEGRMRQMLMKLQEDLGVSSQIRTQGFAKAPRYASSSDGSIVAESEHWSEREMGSEYQRPQSKRSLLEKRLPKKDKKSDGALSDSSDGKSKKKGILKTPATSSSSELDLKSVTLSSGEDEDKSKSKKIVIDNKSGGTKMQSEVMALMNGLDLDGDSRNGEDSGEIPISPPKSSKRTSVGYKLKSKPQSIDGDTEKPANHVFEAKHDTKKEDFGFGSDLDDF